MLLLTSQPAPHTTEGQHMSSAWLLSSLLQSQPSLVNVTCYYTVTTTALFREWRMDMSSVYFIIIIIIIYIYFFFH